jgi:hypothetical protein
MSDLQQEWGMTPLHAEVVQLREIIRKLATTSPRREDESCFFCGSTFHPFDDVRNLIHANDCLWLAARNTVLEWDS